MKTKPKEPIHAMRSAQIAAPLSWTQWKKMWNQPQPYDIRESLIHIVFRQRLVELELQERICFVLDLAERYGADKPEISDGDSLVFRDRNKLCGKAMMALANHFFVPGDYPYILPYEEPVFSKLLWFFGRHKSGVITSNLHPISLEIVGIGEVAKDHHLQTARKFARKFALIAWDFQKAWQFKEERKDYIEKLHGETQKRWREVLDLMDRLNLLDHLLENLPARERFEQMVEMVLHTPHQIGPGQAEAEGKSLNYPASLEEACKHGSKLAEVLLIVRAKIS